MKNRDYIKSFKSLFITITIGNKQKIDKNYHSLLYTAAIDIYLCSVEPQNHDKRYILK